MLARLDSALAFQAEALKLRAQRQEVLAGNIANADTPQYKAVDFDFAKALGAAVAERQQGAGKAPVPAQPDLVARPTGTAGLDGNTVDMDIERVQFADNALRYEASLRFLNSKIKAYLSAIQG